MFGFIIVAVFALFTFVIVSNVHRWIQNNNSPRLTVEAVVVSKRIYTTQQPITNCVVTFQVESGDQLKFFVSVGKYRMLAEGDRGRLSFQGTRYLGFERQR